MPSTTGRRSSRTTRRPASTRSSMRTASRRTCTSRWRSWTGAHRWEPVLAQTLEPIVHRSWKVAATILPLDTLLVLTAAGGVGEDVSRDDATTYHALKGGWFCHCRSRQSRSTRRSAASRQCTTRRRSARPAACRRSRGRGARRLLRCAATQATMRQDCCTRRVAIRCLSDRCPASCIGSNPCWAQLVALVIALDTSCMQASTRQRLRLTPGVHTIRRRTPAPATTRRRGRRRWRRGRRSSFRGPSPSATARPQAPPGKHCNPVNDAIAPHW